MILINDCPFNIKFFPDGTLNMTEMHIDDARTIQLTWKWESLIEEIVIRNIAEFIHDVLRMSFELYIPYFPNARMDRVKAPRRELHTLKYFCKFINSLNAEAVIVKDVHSPVTMTLLERAVEENVRDEISTVITRTGANYMFFPDKGSSLRYEYAVIRTPFYGEKTRDWESGKILGLEVKNPYNIPREEYQDKPILIVDDISSYGGTFHHSANALAREGFGDIYLYITHCENSILEGDAINNPYITHIYTTDSIFTKEHPKISIIY